MFLWLSLILSLPTENANTRMRTWRTLKASGAGVLRDGVYLMPEQDACRQVLEKVAAEVVDAGGTAYVTRIEAPPGADFKALFDRGDEYGALMDAVQAVARDLRPDNASELAKKARKLRKAFAGIVEIDFFPGEAQKQTAAGLQAVELALARVLCPDEPHAIDVEIARLDAAAFKRKTWATRRRPWVDRLASAWLVRTFVDPEATFIWLDNPGTSPAEAVTYDFDGATFSHVGAMVTFEVLIATFGLETPPLQRLGRLVHFLDVGGLQPPEAVGVESVLAGLRESMDCDDRLLHTSCLVFDSLLLSFSGDTERHDKA